MGVFPAARGFIRAGAAQDGGPPVYASRTRRGQNPAPPISETLLHHVQHTRSSVLTRDAAADERFDNADSIAAHQIQAALCVPLISHDTVHGAIYLDADSTSEPFTPTHLQLLSVVGQVAGVAWRISTFREAAASGSGLRQSGRLSRPRATICGTFLQGFPGARSSSSWRGRAGAGSVRRGAEYSSQVADALREPR